jgi:glycosyltransferase involved in cell wall biosynthesis
VGAKEDQREKVIILKFSLLNQILMNEKPNVTIVIPAFNEETAIAATLKRLLDEGYGLDHEIIVVDDGSTDSTADIVSAFPVKLIRHNANKGYGAALKTGIRKARGQKIVLMDSDGQHDPVYLRELETQLAEHDMVIGTRTASSHQVRTRQAGKRVIRWIGEYLVEQKLPDYNSGFRGFDRQIISSMLHIMPNGFSFSTTSTLAFLKEGYNIGTMPIEVAERQGRPSNVKFLKDGTKTIMLILRIIMLFNPLKIFLPASIITFLAGIGFGIYGYLAFERFSNGAIVLTILGMFLFFIGLVADQISILNRK